MKLFTFIFSILFTSQALAHVDHTLGESHVGYHVLFYTLLAIVLYKGITWFRTQKKNKKN